MFALSASRITGSAVKLSVKSRAVRARRAASIRVRAEGEAEKVAVADEVKAADAAWEEKAAEPAAAPVAFSAAIDPADGSVAEAAPLGDDMSMLNDAMIAFKEPRAVEIINGRVAMLGWMAALYAEISNDQSLTRQVINTRTFTLADGVVKTAAGPAAGVFLVPLVVLVVLAASLAPQLRNAKENGLEEVPEDFFVFKADSEMANGRAAMVGLASLFIVERVFTHGAAFL